MNKYKDAFIVLIVLVAAFFYLAIIPELIIKYGNIPELNSVPFHEIYGPFAVAWLLGNLIAGLFIFSLYMICYGCHKE